MRRAVGDGRRDRQRLRAGAADRRIAPRAADRAPLSGSRESRGMEAYHEAKKRWMAGELDYTHEGGESYADIRDAAPSLPSRRSPQRHPGETIVVVAHGIVIRVLLDHSRSRATAPSTSPRSRSRTPASMTFVTMATAGVPRGWRCPSERAAALFQNGAWSAPRTGLMPSIWDRSRSPSIGLARLDILSIGQASACRGSGGAGRLKPALRYWEVSVTRFDEIIRHLSGARE